MEKKEHFVVDEINANNDLINDHSDNFLSCMQDFFSKIKEVFKIDIKVEATSSPVSATKEQPKEKEEEYEDDDFEL